LLIHLWVEQGLIERKREAAGDGRISFVEIPRDRCEPRGGAIEVLLAVRAPEGPLDVSELARRGEPAVQTVGAHALVVAAGARVGRRRDRVDAEAHPQRRAVGEVAIQIDRRAQHRHAPRVLKRVELDVHVVVLRPIAASDERASDGDGYDHDA
jgi:hypothetical protein